MSQKGFNSLVRTWLVALVFVAFSFASQNAFAADDGKLNAAGLKTLLENLGYEPKEGKYKSGNTYYRLKKKGQTVTLTTDVYLGNNGQMLWAYAAFWTLKAGQKFPQDVLFEAMKENDKARYVHFSVHKNGNQFTLSGSLPNSSIKPADLRKMLDEMLIFSDRTQHLWNPNYWKNKAAEKKPEATSELGKKEDEKVKKK